MNTIDNYDPSHEVINEVTRIPCMFDEAIKKISRMGYSSNDFMIPANDSFYSHKGQGTVFQSHTKYFKKDRESRHTYNKYPLNKSYTKYIRKTIKATKPPIKRHGWKGKR
jgi:hypothetical protein